MQDAVDQGRTDDRTLSKLALAKGYAALERLSVGLYPKKEEAALRAEACREFDEAERRSPLSADAHLAMARIYVYSVPDLVKARAEFAAAEKLGAKFGPAKSRSRGMRGASGRSNWQRHRRARPGTPRSRPARFTGKRRGSISRTSI